MYVNIDNFMKLVKGVALVMLLSLVMGASCSDSANEEEIVPCSVLFRQTGTTECEVAGYAFSLTLDLTAPAGTEYTITVKSKTGDDFCWTSRVNKQTQKSDKMVITSRIEKLYVDQNDSAMSREADVEVKFSTGELFELEIEQGVYNKPELYDRNWTELPDYFEDDNTVVVSHSVDIATDKNVRSMTICYDIEKCYANWVAYPLHKCYMDGKYERTNAWQYDPKIPVNYQADLSRGSYSGSSQGWIRGHQLMSNHRYTNYSSEVNAQTFYSTNIMPQNTTFNSGLWNDVEYACTQMGSTEGADTLYCVTGAYGVQGWTTDKAGKKIAIPEYCFKVMLKARSSKNQTPVWEIESESELMAIGYWAKNDKSSNSGKASDYTMSVADVEALTGYKFFPHLKPGVAESVKAQHKPSEWNIR